MSGVKHTTGPWSVSVVNSVVCVQATDEIGQQFDICSMSNFDMEANARLIAAAPDLLEALTEARLTLSLTRTNIMVEMKKSEGAAYRWEGVPELLANRIAQCDAAIARARGES